MRLHATRLSFVILLLSSLPALAAPDFILRRGVIVDPGRSAIYLSAPGGGIDAVDAASGRLLWRSGSGDLPVALDEKLLVAQIQDAPPEKRLRVALLDVTAGGRKVAEGTLELPEGVRALVEDKLGRAFRLTAEPDNGGFLLRWSYKERHFDGNARLPGNPAPTTTSAGAARLDVKGAIGVVDAPPRRVQADAVAVQLMAAGALPHPPWRAGDVLAISTGGREGPLTLKRWDARTGAPLSEQELLKKAVVALPSADTAHLVASERVAQSPGEPEYRWTIFSLETGERVGELRRSVSAAPFFVQGGNVVYESQAHGFRRGETWVEEPLQLEAVRLSTGVPLWDHAVRDLEYRGPRPPAR